MFQWNKYPLIRVLVPLIAGIFVYPHDAFLISHMYLFCISLLLFFPLAALMKYRNFSTRSLVGMSVFIVIFMLSVCYTSFYMKYYQPPYQFYQENEQMLTAVIKEPPVENRKSMKLIVEIKQFVLGDSLQFCRTKAVFYLAKDENSKNLVYGDEIICYAKISPPAEPKNPHEFDYKSYLLQKGIPLQAYVQANAWKKTGKRSGSLFFRTANLMRNRFLAIFNAANMDINELGIISAILLGCDDKLDPNLAQSYASTGVSHLLCVSGMHVGIIYMLLAFCLNFLNRSKRKQIIRSIILIVTIWLYACITGLFPSVMRAATMFSFVAFGGLIGRKTNTYNSLLSSMVFLLLVNPLLLFQVGFQFSFLAVFGIVWIHPPLKSLYRTKSLIGNYIWEIITVSLAAQLIISPLYLFYFHYFPNYFLLTNIFLVSFLPVVISGGIAVLTFSFWAFAYRWIALGLVYVIKIMNWFVVHIEALPHSVTENIHISLWQMLLFYGVILSVLSAFIYKNKTALFLTFFCAIALATTAIDKQYQTNTQKTMLIYHTRAGSIIDCIDGKTSSLFGDSTALFDAEIYKYNISNNHIFHQIRKVEKSNKQPFISFYGKTVFIISEPVSPCRNCPKLKIDYLILSHKDISIETIQSLFDFKLLIFDSNLPFYKTKQLKEFCNEKNIAFHDLKDSGAFVVNIP